MEAYWHLQACSRGALGGLPHRSRGLLRTVLEPSMLVGERGRTLGASEGGLMSQCKAETLSGTQCVANTAPPSKTLCGRHQKMVAAGTAVINFDSGRKIPAPAHKAVATRLAVRTQPAPGVPRSQARAGSAEPISDTSKVSRMAGEHPLTCDGAQCASRPLAGSNYCMKHQSLA